MVSTQPGTEIKVTPDKEVPIIPKATKYQGEELFALKKVLLLADFPVKNDISTRTPKYEAINKKI